MDFDNFPIPANIPDKDKRLSDGKITFRNVFEKCLRSFYVESSDYKYFHENLSFLVILMH